LKFKEFRGFITEYSANISPGGMFIITESPQEPGSVFDFEFRLADDDFQIIHGLGEVVWVREESGGPDRPRGMGIRFLHLDEGSRELIEKMVEEHVRSGGTPFDLDRAAPRGDELEVGSPVPGESPTSLSDPPETPEPEAGYGLPADASGDEGAREIEAETETGTISSETPPGAPEGAGPAPEGDRGSFERFDAALASLKGNRNDEEDLPPGFDEVSAALRGDEEGEELMDPDELPEGVVAPPPPSDAGGGSPVGLEERPRPDLTDETFDTDDAFEKPHSPEGASGTGPEKARRPSRWILPGLLVVAVGAVVAHLTLPGGLPGVLTGQVPEAADPEGAASRETTGSPATEGPLGSKSPPEPDSEPSAKAATGEEEPSARTVSRTALPPGESNPPVSQDPFRTLEEIDWSQEEDRTVFELTTDGLVQEDRYRSFTLGGGNPRILLRLRDVTRPYSPTTLEVGSDQVARIRLGYHREPTGNELHVVFDLTSPRVEPLSLDPDGNRLQVILGVPGPR
ncbi:MAG: TIGR02266 family protein, partial [Thermoanaerobaculia bacterium]|nr:TIGR02266 family protein [Thermoanaerobaculia bacterium]